jgi:hypothetical protein
MKFHFKELASRLIGVSVAVFGVSWNPPEPERKIIRELLIFLEARRMFPYECCPFVKPLAVACIHHMLNCNVLQALSEGCN